MPRNARIARILRVVKLLDESRRGLPAAQLAEKVGTPLRSLYRDLDAIEQAGFPLLRADGRFRCVEGCRASLDRALDADELLALYTARQLLRPLSKMPLGLALDRLWARFAAGRETLYLLAWYRLPQAVRVFAVQRFAALSATRKTFAPRPEAHSAAALRDAFCIYREGRVRRVSLRFRGPAARLMLERTVRPGQTLERLRGGEVRLTFETDGLIEVARWVLGFGADVVVEGPEELEAGVRGQLVEAMGRYAEGVEAVSRSGTRRGYTAAARAYVKVRGERGQGMPKSVNEGGSSIV